METNKGDLSELIDRYEKGDSSLEDDRILMHYFNGRHSENEPQSLRAPFNYFQNKKIESPSDAFEKRLHQIVDNGTSRGSNVRWLLRVAAILVVGFGIAWFGFLRSHWSEEITTTGPKEKNQIVLSDGTTVLLNGESELRYKKVFDDQRIVYLKGEAYFEVQRDTLKPFVVHTGDVATEVLGTSFNLRHFEVEKSTEINVNSGQLRFGADQKVTLMKGEGAVKFADEAIVQTVATNVNAHAWRTGKLKFENEKMTNVVRDIERYFQVRIELTTTSLLDCHFTGEFNQPELQDVLNVVGYSLNVQYTLANDKYILSGQGCQP